MRAHSTVWGVVCGDAKSYGILRGHFTVSEVWGSQIVHGGSGKLQDRLGASVGGLREVPKTIILFFLEVATSH